MSIYEHIDILIFYENGFILKTAKDKAVDAECLHFHNIDLQDYDWVHQHNYMQMISIPLLPHDCMMCMLILCILNYANDVRCQVIIIT